MTMSIRRMTLGSGYKYLMSSVAQSDGASQQASALTRYYAESGTPPGRFLGEGLAGLLDRAAGLPAGGVQGGGVARDAQLGGHRLDRLGEHRGRRGVVEVGHGAPILRGGSASPASRSRGGRSDGRGEG